jgi:hypothetical protein
MLKRLFAPRIVLATLIFSSLAHSQSAPPQSAAQSQSAAQKDQKSAPAAPAPIIHDGWGRAIAPPAKDQKPAPAPRHDISGTWEPANGSLDGGGFLGAKAMPQDGKPEHQLPFTPLGLETFNQTKPTIGPRMVLPADTNDPVAICDPQGMPREDLFQLRTTQILQTPSKVMILYQFDQIWRVIWTDGRELPKDPEPRWFGYSVGKWIDDDTLVVETSGMDERTWLDLVGRPHSDELRVEERFHRVDRDHLEWTVKIDDPKMYTKPWLALDNFPMKLQPPDFDVREMICSPSEAEQYNKLIATPVSDTSSNPASNKDSR